MSSDYLALLLADDRLPSGAHTQSAGVESALRHGMPIARVPDYLTARLRTVTRVEAATSVVARALWLGGSGLERTAALRAVDRAWRVRTPSDALRTASDSLGRSALRLAATLTDTADVSGPLPWCRPVVVGVLGAALGLQPAQVAHGVAYDDVQTVVAAALKLEPFDPSEAVRWVVQARDDVESLVTAVAHLTETHDIPAHSAPLVEEWAQRHDTMQRRLFRA